MKQIFMVIVDSKDDIHIGQIGAPLLDALGLVSVQVEKIELDEYIARQRSENEKKPVPE